MSKLSATKCKAIKAPGMYGDGGGLYLNVKPGGARSWIQRVTMAGRRREMGLGSFPVVGLAAARALALANKTALAEGRDPFAENERGGMPTFREATERTFAASKPHWRSGKHVDKWWRSLESYAFPILGDMPVDEIGREDVLRVLTPIWGSKQETARRVRQRIRTVLKWSMAHGFVDFNMAGEVIDGALPPQRRIVQHMRSLPYVEVADALRTVEASRASIPAKLCLRFLVLTAARSGEARGATWDEVDMDAREWRIPAERMKASNAHRVPLSDAAQNVLEQAAPFRDESNLIFPSVVKLGSQMSDMTLTKVLRSTGLAERATVHGFRSSFRDWAAECTNAPHAVMELSLAHTVGSSVEQAYARSELIEKRRALLQQWSDYVTKPGADIVSIFDKRALQ